MQRGIYTEGGWAVCREVMGLWVATGAVAGGADEADENDTEDELPQESASTFKSNTSKLWDQKWQRATYKA